MGTLRPAVFLDRDGVLNEARIIDRLPHPPRDPAELVVLEGAREACATLRDAGYALVVVTNQPDIARGVTERGVVEKINARLGEALALELFYICPHDDDDRCGCRKPAPGMLLAAARDHALDLSRSVMVGDRWRDVEAGRRAGCRTVHIDGRYDEPPPRDSDYTTDRLFHATEWIVDQLEEADVA